jgi:DNA modification methylase
MQGDCLERMKEIPSGLVDMVLTDPPYGTTACKWDSIIPLEPMWEQLKRIIKPNGAIVITASQPFTTTLISSNMKMFKYCWVYHKSRATGHLNANRMPMNDVEDVVVFYKRPPTYNPQKTKGKPYSVDCKTSGTEIYGKQKPVKFVNKGERHPTRIIKIKTGSNLHCKPVHPTQKPVALMEYLIKTYTNEGETVLDFTMGSGTTGMASKNLNRNFIGIELDQTYFSIAKDRIEKA